MAFSLLLFSCSSSSSLPVGEGPGASSAPSPRSPGEFLMREAEKAAASRNYLRAREYAEEALRFAAEEADSAHQAGEQNAKMKKTLLLWKKRLGEYCCLLANETMLSGGGGVQPLPEDCRTAIALCERAASLSPALAARAGRMAEEYRKRLAAAEYREQMNSYAEAARKAGREKEISRLLAEGNTLRNAGLFSEARDCYEEILKINPFHAAASEELGKLYRSSFRAAEMRTDVTRAERAAEAAWKHVSPLPPPAPGKNAPPDEGSTFQANVQDENRDPGGHPEDSAARILDSVFIPRIAWTGLPLAEALVFLEKEPVRQGRGSVKFRYDGFDPSDGAFPLLDFETDEISVGEALDSVCAAVGLVAIPSNEGPEVRLILSPVPGHDKE